MNMSSRPFPSHVPTLTEVVEEPPVPELTSGDAVLSDFVADLMAQPAPTIDVAVLTEVVPEQDLLVEHVAASVEDEWPESPPAVDYVAEVLVHASEPNVADQLTDRLTHELTQALQPILSQHTQALVQALHAELDMRLRDMVAQAVAQELAKQRQV